ncbi:MAG TPA: LLM class F420-dependent oxidoreductase [Dehalococcoidia bacterium]
MQFGLVLPHFRHVASPEFLRRFARRAEELGYDSLWATDHLVIPEAAVPRFGATFYEPLTTLAYVAAETQRIRLGTSALILPYRNPVHQAKVLATLDVLSGGRTVFAVAVGWAKDEMDALGVPFERRGALATEYLRLFRELWRNPRPVFHGRTVHVEGVAFQPQPAQDPLPLWGAGNSASAIRRAARFCQGWHPTRPTPEQVQEGRAYLRHEAARYGRDPDEFVIAARLPLRLLDRPAADAAPLVGTPDQVVESLQRYRAAGVTHVVLDTFYSAPALHDQTPDDVLRTAERFAAEIRPRLADGG